MSDRPGDSSRRAFDLRLLTLDLQRFAESKRDRLVRLGRERRAEARHLEARAKIVSQEARSYTRHRRPSSAAAARSEAADLRARAARQKELAVRYSRELAELRAERARERARRRAQLLREREARRRRKRVVRKKRPAPRRHKPVRRGGRARFILFLSKDLGPIFIRSRSKAARSRIGRHHALVGIYRDTGDEDVLRQIESEYGGRSEIDDRSGLKAPSKKPPGTGKRYQYAADRNSILEHAWGFHPGDQIYVRSSEIAA